MVVVLAGVIVVIVVHEFVMVMVVTIRKPQYWACCE